MFVPSAKVINTSRTKDIFKDTAKLRNDKCSNLSKEENETELSLSNILVSMNKYFDFISEKSASLNSIKAQVQSDTNRELINEKQRIYYMTMKQLCPVIDRLGRSLTGNFYK